MPLLRRTQQTWSRTSDRPRNFSMKRMTKCIPFLAIVSSRYDYWTPVERLHFFQLFFRASTGSNFIRSDCLAVGLGTREVVDTAGEVGQLEVLPWLDLERPLALAAAPLVEPLLEGPGLAMAALSSARVGRGLSHLAVGQEGVIVLIG